MSFACCLNNQLAFYRHKELAVIIARARRVKTSTTYILLSCMQTLNYTCLISSLYLRVGDPYFVSHRKANRAAELAQSSLAPKLPVYIIINQ